jgi:hypothetical protein
MAPREGGRGGGLGLDQGALELLALDLRHARCLDLAQRLGGVVAGGADGIGLTVAERP